MMLLPIILKFQHQKSDQLVSTNQIPNMIVTLFILTALALIVIILSKINFKFLVDRRPFLYSVFVYFLYLILLRYSVS